MATARDLINSAFRKGHVIAEGETAAAEQIVPALETFNDMLEAWRDDGLDLGLGTLTLDTVVAVDAGAHRAIKYNLAVELANDAHVSVPDVTLTIAERSRSALAGRRSGTRKIRFNAALTPRGRYVVGDN